MGSGALKTEGDPGITTVLGSARGSVGAVAGSEAVMARQEYDPYSVTPEL